MKQTKVYIYGKHALEEALRYAPKSLLKVFFDEKSLDSKFKKIIKESGVPTAPLRDGAARADLRAGAAHQGVIGQVSLHQLLVPFKSFSEKMSVSSDTALVLLQGIQDPHNVGAIIRSAAAFGAGAVLLPEKEQSPITGTVLKVSAGMAFRIPLLTVTDMHATVRDIKSKGFVVYALAGEGAKSISEETFEKPALFILGNEAKGVAPNVRALCDTVLSIPMSPRAESLNVAASGAVALYEWSSQHPAALTS